MTSSPEHDGLDDSGTVVQPSTETEPDEPLSLDPDHPLGGHRLLRLLGRGGFAEVWEAERLSDGRRVALKALRPARALSDQARTRFEIEGRVAASLSHPRTVYVFSADVIEHRAVIVMELMRGGTLQDRLDTRGPMQSREAVDAILDLVEGLEAAARLGIVHRDIKPSNCFLDASGRVKVGDFGIARSSEFSPTLTASGVFVGTPAFASPEQFLGRRADHYSDQYSVGATLYALLSGHPPFQGGSGGEFIARVLTQGPEPFSRHGVSVPRSLRRIVSRLLSKDPSNRYPDYGALQSALIPLSSRDSFAPDPVRRFGAYLVDLTLSTAIVSGLLAASSGVDPFRWIQRPTEPRSPFAWTLFAVPVVIYTLFEWLWQRSPGKRVFGLYIVSADGGPIGARQSLLRNATFWSLSNAPGWAAFLVPDWMAVLSLIGAALPVLSMRPWNGFAGVHELLSGTRVRAVAAHSALVVGVTDNAESRHAPSGESIAQRGPYRIVSETWRTAEQSLSVSVDDLLARRVWIHESIALGNSHQSGERASRPARLQWLQGDAAEGRRWDAYECPQGAPLVESVRSTGPLLWPACCKILLELLTELEQGLAAGDLPEPLSLDHLWIDSHGHLKMLEFPATRARGGDGDWRALPWMVSMVCLQGTDGLAAKSAKRSPCVPLPGRVRTFLDTLSREPLDFQRVRALRAELQVLLRCPGSVPRAVRATHLLCAWSLPGIVAVAAFFGSMGSLLARSDGSSLKGSLFATGVSLDLAMVVLGIAAPLTLLGSAVFRGGPFLGLFGMEVQCADGSRATRARCLFRATIAMAPPLLLSMPVWIVAILGAVLHWSSTSISTVGVGSFLAAGIRTLPAPLRVAGAVTGVCLSALFLVGLYASVLEPGCGIQDRVARTRLMPR